jgi:hypothetical protein
MVGSDSRSGTMTLTPVMRELSPLERPHRRGEATKSIAPRLVAIVTNFELIMVAAFCALGLLMTAMCYFVFLILEY